MTAPTASELAKSFDLPAGVFQATVEAANRAALGEIADPLNRKAFARPLSPPFWGVCITGALAPPAPRTSREHANCSRCQYSRSRLSMPLAPMPMSRKHRASAALRRPHDHHQTSAFGDARSISGLPPRADIHTSDASEVPNWSRSNRSDSGSVPAFSHAPCPWP